VFGGFCLGFLAAGALTGIPDRLRLSSRS